MTKAPAGHHNAQSSDPVKVGAHGLQVGAYAPSSPLAGASKPERPGRPYRTSPNRTWPRIRMPWSWTRAYACHSSAGCSACRVQARRRGRGGSQGKARSNCDECPGRSEPLGQHWAQVASTPEVVVPRKVNTWPHQISNQNLATSPWDLVESPARGLLRTRRRVTGRSN
jgi:hypothetical protein